MRFPLTACDEGTNRYGAAPDTAIAIARDPGWGGDVLTNGGSGIAYDPDGCQGWIIDDGVEGYTGHQFDPVSGLPGRNDPCPPGTVMRNYQTADAGIADFVPPIGRSIPN